MIIAMQRLDKRPAIRASNSETIVYSSLLDSDQLDFLGSGHVVPHQV
jgi:hypothetical protein